MKARHPGAYSRSVSIRIAAFAVLACLAGTSAQAQVRLSVREGRVSLAAADASVAQILKEWASAGHFDLQNVELVVEQRVTIELVDVPEGEALATLLNARNGYIAVNRAGDTSGPSTFGRVIITGTARASAAQPDAPDPAAAAAAATAIAAPDDTIATAPAPAPPVKSDGRENAAPDNRTPAGDAASVPARPVQKPVWGDGPPPLFKPAVPPSPPGAKSSQPPPPTPVQTAANGAPKVPGQMSSVPAPRTGPTIPRPTSVDAPREGDSTPQAPPSNTPPPSAGSTTPGTAPSPAKPASR